MRISPSFPTAFDSIGNEIICPRDDLTKFVFNSLISLIRYHFSIKRAEAECTSYKKIDGAKRSVNYKGDYSCDSGMSEAWYRFEGSAGGTIPESPPETNYCGTHAPGWLNGKHPDVGQGAVVRQVCYHWSAVTCRWSNEILIINCGGYFVYKLKKTPVCHLRYCVTKGMNPLSGDEINPFIPKSDHL